MPKASPIIRSFNAGEFSPLVEGRTDLDRYPASLRSMSNYVAAPQGPAIPRSGTAFLGEAYSHATKSELVPFVFDETDTRVIEFADQKVRFYDEAGLLVYTPVSITITSTSPFVFTSASLNAAIGDQIVFASFDAEYNLNAVQYTVTAKTGSDYTVDAPWPTGLSIPVGVEAALVYAEDSPYDEAGLDSLRPLQSLDVIYLTNLKNKPYKLKRNDTYDWEFEAVSFVDGPYLDANITTTSLTPDATGKGTPNMTGNTAPSGTAYASGSNGSNDPWKAFDDDDDESYWESNTDQTGTLGYQTPSGQGFVCDGYAINAALDNANLDYTNKNYAPSTWTFEGSNDGTNWDVLDNQIDYVEYESNKSVFFPLANETSYEYYQIRVKNVERNGPLKVRIGSFILREANVGNITVTASSTAGINVQEPTPGFASTDVGRLIRLQGSDGTWRSAEIKVVTSTTVVEVQLLGQPFPSLEPITNWRLGYWSDTTGYPNYASFFQDRLWFGGSNVAPDLIVSSNSGDYENMKPTTDKGEVLDTSSIVIRLNSRKLSRIKWMEESSRGLLVGTGSQEYTIKSADPTNSTVRPESIRAIKSTQRGSADTEPVAIDDQVVYNQRSGRTIREYAFNFEADNFKSPSMTLLSNHLGIKKFKKMAYAAEPYSIIWFVREDGSLTGLTYNRDENVVGWHRHDLEGQEVESIAVIPAEDQLQDVLFMVVKREIDGVDKRYIERLTRFWDFDMLIEDAHYVDSGLKYVGVATKDFYGLTHLEGQEVYGLADGIPVGPFTVTDGKVTLEHEASKILIGLGFEGQGETSRLENGAADGTAQGKEKRMHGVSIMLWQSYGGEIGVWNEDVGEVEWSPVEYPEDLSQVSDIKLYDGVLGPIVPAAGYNKRGSIFFRRPKDNPLPFNIVGLMPQLHTQDR